ncbi:MAG: hypothetical protein BBJ57_02310 [Desulfobacterales bacterium PC51MH44]|nr:MAG: hypothetical protein BBJ57_02310 [Desulfobacterales bacterium PC51MH44]
MKNQFTKEFRAILERKLRVYYRHYSNHRYFDGSTNSLTFKEFCRLSTFKHWDENCMCSPDDTAWIEIRIGRAYFGILDTARTLAIVYKNANRKNCRC